MPQRFAADLATGESDVPFRRWVHAAPFGEQVLADRDTPWAFDREAAESVVRWWEHYQSNGRRTIFDWGHGSLFDAPPESAGKSGVVLRWDIRPDGLWALGEFTDRAAALIRSGDFDQVSPEVWSQVKNLETDEWEDGPAIFAIALTARPALTGLDVLAASTQLAAFAAKFGKDDAGGVLGLISERIDSLALSGALGDLGGMVERSEGLTHQWAIRLMNVDPDWLTATVENRNTGRFFALGLGESDGSLVIDSIRELELLPKTAGDAGPAGEFTMSDERKPDTDTDTGADARAEAILTAVGEATPEQITEALALAAAAREAGAETPEAVQALATRPPADEGLRAEVQALTVSVREQQATIEALSTEGETLRAERADRVASDAVAAYEAQGRITPAMRPHMVKMAKADPEGFAAMAADLPVMFSVGEAGTAGAPGQSGSEAPETLHSVAKAEALALATESGRSVTDHFPEALAKVRRERPDLYSAWSSTAPTAQA